MTHAVLIVDDEPRIFNALRRALHRENYELLSASDAEQALSVLSSHKVDVIIADENMPGMKGSALLARVRQQWPRVVRMMLTGDARLETVVAAVNRGEIYRFFIKPCNEVELIVSIRDALQSRTEHDAAPAKGDATGGADARDSGRPPQPIRLDHDDATPAQPARNGAHKAEPRVGGADDDDAPGSVFRLDDSENVDSLLDELRNELEKLDS